MTRESLLTAVGGDTGLLQRMASICLEEDAPRLEAAVRRAVETGDRDALQCAAHAVLSLATAFKADALGRAAAKVERDAHALDSSLLREEMTLFCQEFEALQQALRTVVENVRS